MGVQVVEPDEESSDFAHARLKAAVKQTDRSCKVLDVVSKLGIVIILLFVISRLSFLELRFENKLARDVEVDDKQNSLSTQALEESILTLTKELKSASTRVVESQEKYAEALQESVSASTKELKSESTRGVEQSKDTSQSLPIISLEDLMYKYGSDKSKDDHAYTNIYQLLFNPIQYKVKKVLELGIAAGQSLQAWREYFPNAQITGVDPNLNPKVKENLDRMSRVDYALFNILTDGITQDEIKEELRADLESFDIIIDDGPHTFSSQRDFLVRLFPFLKPGGIYIIEDITPMSTKEFRHPDNESHTKELNDILTGNDCSYVDTTIGHRDFEVWHKRWPAYARDREHHNSNMIVIRKRDKPLRDVFVNSAHHISMHVDSIVQHEEENELGA